MTRFHWLVEKRVGAFVPPGGVAPCAGEPGLVDVMCEAELPGCARTLRACLTMQAAALTDAAPRDLGIALAYGDAPGLEWRGPLATALATAFAREGYLVVREIGPHSDEVARQRAFEKCLDTAATSPYGRRIARWLLAGLGNGARVAAVAGARARAAVAGQMLFAYPLAAPMPTIKGSTMPDSAMPLLRLIVPALLVAPGADGACPLAALRMALKAATSPDVRLVVAEGTDGSFRAPGAAAVSPELLASLLRDALAFAAAAAGGRLDDCGLARVKGPEDGAPTPAQLAAVQAAHLRMQEEDALAFQAPPLSLLPPEEEADDAAAGGGGGEQQQDGTAGGGGGDGGA
ncbi:hypothetical protein Rsub_03661 [Raphidocelis subcapitata]|uniref:Uncharacterized protein n=1 Tax=Raphidocelis subcapitata TaxID=307507 RepID=A0A2V0NUN8_9CHLO|nr:hypothetical protein Rsub_03661 [Raphidocelis subcapitata]|eukprot:GBF91341.1 hypothetical protein Rsub_03661 [Raphidocelis subcapitata]